MSKSSSSVKAVPEDVTVVGVPAKVVRVHGQKDEEAIHDIEEGREYYSEAQQALHRDMNMCYIINSRRIQHGNCVKYSKCYSL